MDSEYQDDREFLLTKMGHRLEQLTLWCCHTMFRFWPPTLLTRWALNITLAFCSLCLALLLDINEFLTYGAFDAAEETNHVECIPDNDASNNTDRHDKQESDDGLWYGQNPSREIEHVTDDEECTENGNAKETDIVTDTGGSENGNRENERSSDTRDEDSHDYQEETINCTTPPAGIVLTLNHNVLWILTRLLSFVVHGLYCLSLWFQRRSGLLTSETVNEKEERICIYGILLTARDAGKRPRQPSTKELLFDRVLDLYAGYITKFLGLTFGLKRPLQVGKSFTAIMYNRWYKNMCCEQSNENSNDDHQEESNSKSRDKNNMGSDETIPQAVCDNATDENTSGKIDKNENHEQSNSITVQVQERGELCSFQVSNKDANDEPTTTACEGQPDTNSNHFQVTEKSYHNKESCRTNLNLLKTTESGSQHQHPSLDDETNLREDLTGYDKDAPKSSSPKRHLWGNSKGNRKSIFSPNKKQKTSHSNKDNEIDNSEMDGDVSIKTRSNVADDEHNIENGHNLPSELVCEEQTETNKDEFSPANDVQRLKDMRMNEVVHLIDSLDSQIERYTSKYMSSSNQNDSKSNDKEVGCGECDDKEENYVDNKEEENEEDDNKDDEKVEKERKNDESENAAEDDKEIKHSGESGSEDESGDSNNGKAMGNGNGSFSLNSSSSPLQSPTTPKREFCDNPGAQCRSIYNMGNPEQSSDVDTGVGE